MDLSMIVYSSTLGVILMALLLALRNFFNIKKPKTHVTKEEDEMFNFAKTIREGAKTFLDTEYGTIIVVVALVALGFSLFIEASSGLSFILGACMSSAAVYISMYGAAYANYRVVRRAFKSKSVGRSCWTALKGGSIAGLSVQAFGMLGITVIYILQYLLFRQHPTGHGLIVNLPCDANMMRCTTYSLGCSTVAMFNRVAGGNFTKSADISADKMNKLDLGFDEDDPRIPNVLLDFIGDLVNDVAGNCSDLEESFAATLVAAQLISNTVFNSQTVKTGILAEAYINLYDLTCLFPIIVATIGLFGCIVGIGVAMLRKEKMSDNPAGELNKVTYIAATISVIGDLIVTYFMFGGIALYKDFHFGWVSPWIATVFGILSGVLIGKSTEFYTSTDYRFVRKLAETSKDGAADLLTRATALGFRSSAIPIGIVAASIYISYSICGLYGIAMASVGMLSFVGATVSIDAFGPIADNAGGIAEACHLNPAIRRITDVLDAVGNTTAAIGKGSAIGSAAYATTSLNISYIGIFSLGTALILNIADPKTLSGALVGTALLAYFSFMLLSNLMDSTHVLKVEGQKLIDADKDNILAGKALPDYNALVKIGTKQSIQKMTAPSLLALLSPIPCLFLFGFEFVGGLMIGVILLGVVLAIYTSNTGGALDNAKKTIEEGLLPGEVKGGEAHRNTVIGDTFGDGLKDVWAVCIDIFSKSLSTSACTIAPIVVAIQQNGGIPSLAEVFSPVTAFVAQVSTHITGTIAPIFTNLMLVCTNLHL